MLGLISRGWHMFMGLWVEDIETVRGVPLKPGVVHDLFICGGWPFKAEIVPEYVAIRPRGETWPLDYGMMSKSFRHRDSKALQAYNWSMVRRTDGGPMFECDHNIFVLRVHKGELPRHDHFIAREGRDFSEAQVLEVIDDEKDLIMCVWIREAGLVE